MTEAIEPRQVHETLTTEFTDRYLQGAHLTKAAYSVPYDPANTLCDYDRTTWPARPNATLGIPVGKLILAKTHHMGVREVETVGVRPFADRAGELAGALGSFPLLLVNGHAPDMQAALSSVSATLAIARHDRNRGIGSFRENFEAMARIAHTVGTRGFGPIMIGRPNLPIKSLVGISQWVMHPHLSFPDNKRMRESPLPASFKSDYNDVFKADLLAAVRGESSHPYGYHEIVSTPPAGTADLKGVDQAGDPITVTAEIKPGTIELAKAMQCGLLPVFGHFGRGKSPSFVSLGEIIPPDEVTDASLPTIMSDLAQFRRSKVTKGERPVYYAGDPEVLLIQDSVGHG